MSAVMGHATLPAATRRAWSVLGACVAGAERWFYGVVYALFLLPVVGIALYAVQVKGKPPAEAGKLVLITLVVPTALLWALWFSRALLVAVQARGWRMPALEHAALHALGLGFALSVLLPASLLSAAGAAPLTAFAGLACAAAAALLLALLPAWATSLLCLLPLLRGVLQSPPLSGYPLQASLPWLALVLPALTYWRWRFLLRSGGSTHGVWSRTFVFNLGQQFSLNSLRRGESWRMPAWTLASAPIAAAGVTAMRAWLGWPFAPLGWAQRIVQLAIMIAALLLFPLVLLLSDSTVNWRSETASWIVLFVSAVLVVQFAVSLRALMQSESGEWAELALLPGWGDAATARRTLLRAISAVPAVVFAALSLLLLAIAIMGEADALGHALLLLMAGGLALMTAVGCLRPLAGQSLTAAWAAALLLLGPPLVIATLFGVVGRLRDPGGIDWGWAVCAAWLLLYVALVPLLRSAWRGVQARPHPFLRE